MPLGYYGCYRLSDPEIGLARSKSSALAMEERAFRDGSCAPGAKADAGRLSLRDWILGHKTWYRGMVAALCDSIMVVK